MSMSEFSQKAFRLLLDEDGPTTVEYAMMLLLVLLGVLTAVTAFGEATADSFEGSANTIEEAMGRP